MGRKALQVVVQLLGDILEVDLFLDVERCLCLLRQDMGVDIFLETATELWGSIFPLASTSPSRSDRRSTWKV